MTTLHDALAEQRRLGTPAPSPANRHPRLVPRFADGRIEFDPPAPVDSPDDGHRAITGVLVGAVLGAAIWLAIGWLAARALL